MVRQWQNDTLCIIGNYFISWSKWFPTIFLSNIKKTYSNLTEMFCMLRYLSISAEKYVCIALKIITINDIPYKKYMYAVYAYIDKTRNILRTVNVSESFMNCTLLCQYVSSHSICFKHRWEQSRTVSSIFMWLR